MELTNTQNITPVNWYIPGNIREPSVFCFRRFECVWPLKGWLAHIINELTQLLCHYSLLIWTKCYCKKMLAFFQSGFFECHVHGFYI